MTFMNHGCNATYNFDDVFGTRLRGTKNFVTEQNATKDFDVVHDIYDPISDRHDGGNSVVGFALWDIKAGDEILCNYIFYTNDEEDWWPDVNSLKNICDGNELGLITISERERKESVTDELH